jgi:hypothetical protein
MSRILPAGLAAGVLLFAGLAFAKPSMTAPAKAKVGDEITVTAKGLSARGRYAVRLISPKSPNPDWTCVAQLARSKDATATSIRLTGTIPARMRCYSGFPASREGRIKVTPGRYVLTVSIPASSSGTVNGSSVAERTIKITG